MLVRLIGWFCLFGVVVVASNNANYTETSSEDKPDDVVKSDTAAGRHGHGRGRHDRGRYSSREYDDYDHYGSYGHRHGYYPQQPFYLPPPLLDQYVCDLDASVLLSMDSHSYGYNKAVRVRCADVTNDIDSCNVCCMNSARKDTSITNDQIRSFLVLVDNHKKDYYKKDHHKKDKDDRKSKEKDEDHSDEDDEMKRRKRSADYGYGSHYYPRERYHPLKVKSVPWEADDYYNNVKCVCCAPKKDVAVPILAQSPPTSPYAQPVPLVQTVQAPAFNTQPSWSSQPQQAAGSVWPQPQPISQPQQATGSVWPQQPQQTVQQTQPTSSWSSSGAAQPPAPPSTLQSQVTSSQDAAPQQPAATSSQATWNH